VAGCYEEITPDMTDDGFVAVIEDFADETKTSLTSGNYVAWSEDDRIGVFQGVSTPDCFQVAYNSVGSTKASFGAISTSGSSGYDKEYKENIAIYPYNSKVACLTNKVTGGVVYSYTIKSVQYPEIQTYKQNSFPSGALVMAAITEGLEDRNVDMWAGAPEQYSQYNVDSLYAHFTDDERYRAISAAVDKAKEKKDKVDYNALMLDDYQRYIRKHEIELHRKFTLAFACLIFFFIGAPLGAITRKGGLGAPVVISVVMFIIYYIIDNTGYKMAREALWPCWAGMWLSSMVLLPIGIFLTYKAATDSALFNPEVWMKYLGYIKIKVVKLVKRIFVKHK
jgi:hypothetical protein